MNSFIFFISLMVTLVLAIKTIDRMEANGAFNRPTRVIIVADSSACGGR